MKAKHLLFSLIISSLVLILAEIGCRIFLPVDPSRYRIQEGVFRTLDESAGDYVREDPELFWSFPSYIPYNGRSTGLFSYFFTNSRGLRDDEIVIPKPPKASLVLCLGDSCTFGVKIPYEESYPKSLERLLNLPGSTHEWLVVNAGVPGYSSFQGLHYFRRSIGDYQPDVVLVGFGLNDRSYWDNRSDEEHYRLLHASGIRAIPARSQLYLNLRRFVLWARFRLIKPPVSPTPEATQPGTRRKRAFRNEEEKSALYNGGVPRVSVAEFRRNLTEMTRLARSRKSGVVFINWPLRAQVLPPPNELNQHQQAMVELAGELSVPLIDLRVVLKDAPPSIWLDRFHLTGEGYALVARALAELILRHPEKIRPG